MTHAARQAATCARCDDADALRAEVARLRNRLETVAILVDVLHEHAVYATQAAAPLNGASIAVEAGTLRAALDWLAASVDVVGGQIRAAALGQPMPPAPWDEAQADTERGAT